jgi:hypothetical protein
MAFDLKCAVTNAILVVLVYLLVLRVMGLPSARSTTEGGEISYRSLEVLLFVAALIASYGNAYLFASC